MSKNLSNPKTLFDVYELYCAFLRLLHKSNRYDVTAPVRTALIRFTLPKWGFPLTSGKKLTSEETRAGLEFMNKIPISEFKNALAYQHEVFDSLGNVSSSRNYRYHLKKMLIWCREQSWWKNAVKTDAEKYCPPIRLKRGRVSEKVRVTNKKLTSRDANYKYALEKEEIPPELQQELDNFFSFQTTIIGSRKRQDAALRPRSAIAHVNYSHCVVAPYLLFLL